jgi:hypothetical protein
MKVPDTARQNYRWLEREDQALLLQFDEGASLQQLAIEHERTKAAINTRLVRLGRLLDCPELKGYTRVPTLWSSYEEIAE